MHPILFKIQSIPIYTYGIFMALAMLTALVVATWRARAAGFSAAEISDLIFVLFVSGVIGARLFFILQHFEDYQSNIWRIFSFQEGGVLFQMHFL